jgi:hypothetical protein
MHSTTMSSGMTYTALSDADQEAVDDGQRERQAHGQAGALARASL